MTGFGRAAGRHGRLRWNWEAKSVNARSLDVRIRVASGYDRLEIPARKSVVEILGRGSISLILTIEVEREETKLKINQQFVKQVLELQKELEGRVSPEPPRIETLLNVKGATEICESETSDAVIAGIDAKILSSLIYLKLKPIKTSLEKTLKKKNSKNLQAQLNLKEYYSR